MNRIQFYVLIGLSSMLVLLFGLNLWLVHKVTYQQAQVNALQQALTQGRDIQQKLTRLAQRINQDAQKSPPNPALKDILTRQQINFKNPDGGAATNDSTATPPTPSTSTAPSATH